MGTVLDFLRKKKLQILIHSFYWSFFIFFETLTVYATVEDISSAANFDMLSDVITRGLWGFVFYFIGVYFDRNVLQERFLLKGKNRQYAIYWFFVWLFIVSARFVYDLLMLDEVYVQYDKVYDLFHYLTLIFLPVLVLLSFACIRLFEFLFLDDKESKIEIISSLRKEREQLELELNALKARMNPHFLFNALSSMIGLATKNELEETKDMLWSLSQIMRYNLTFSSKKWISLEQEISQIEDYIKFQHLKTTFKQDISFSKPKDIHVRNCLVPPMLFLTLFENAFKHGNLDDEGKGWLKAKLYNEDSYIILEIANSIPAVPKSFIKSSGFGLNNLKTQLDIYFPGRNQFESSKDSKHQAFKAYLKFPLWQDTDV